ncbi:hypothetical protein [Candidatus Poriferisocius sp.]|uniref:hypothetical protein n=1 Tax=Candidatus Poriferisocius sp. TaxID=3101276 RepID=UPI003B017F5C
MDEQGSISILSVGILAMIGVSVLLLGQLGTDAVQQARISAVADVVAMAAAADQQSAAAIATINGATLMSVAVDGFQTEVVVRRGGVTAVARAELLPPEWWRCRFPLPGDPVDLELCPSIPPG